MCGRYVLTGPVSRYTEYFDAESTLDFEPRYNIAPSLVLPVIRRSPDGHRELVPAKWGLLPSWVKDPVEITHPINAKAETVAIKPMFRAAFKTSRVLVPVDAYYEWQAVAGGKEPFLIRLRDGSPMGVAGLLERWQGPAGVVQTFTILTTEPNVLMARIHNRMPAIIQPENFDAWLGGSAADVNSLLGMLSPYPERLMEAYQVSKAVNNPAHEGPSLIEPLEGLV